MTNRTMTSDESNQFVSDFTEACDAIAKEKRISNLAAMQFAVSRDPELGRQLLAFIWDQPPA